MCKKKIFIDMDGVLAKWNTEASFEDTFEKGYFLDRLPQENMIAAVRETLLQSLTTTFHLQSMKMADFIVRLRKP